MMIFRIVMGVVLAAPMLSVAQVPMREQATIVSIQDIGRPLIGPQNVPAHGTGLWYRNDTIFSAQFSGVVCAVACRPRGESGWQVFSLRQVDENISASAVSINGRYVVLGYESGRMEISRNGGRSFEDIPSPTTSRIRRLAVGNDGMIVLGKVPEGDLFITISHGEEWKREMLPGLGEGSVYGPIQSILVDAYGAISFAVAELTANQQTIDKVFFRQDGEEWTIVPIGRAFLTFRMNPETLLVSTVRPVPGRIDDTRITELMSIDIQRKSIDTVFSTVEASWMTAIEHVSFSPYSPVGYCTAVGKIYSRTGTIWEREPLTLPANALRLVNFVYVQPTEVVASSQTTVLRLQLSPLVSVAEEREEYGVGCNESEKDIPANSFVYDVLGRRMADGSSDANMFMGQAGSPRCLIVVDPHTGKSRLVFR
jgi:hypothetical protein